LTKVVAVVAAMNMQNFFFKLPKQMKINTFQEIKKKIIASSKSHFVIMLMP
jgi:hypothetical protein